MSKTAEALAVNQEKLVAAWQQTLPATLNESDHAEVSADEANPDAIRIHIQTAGHTEYSFDFICTYVDTREVRVELVDAERANTAIDERKETVQQLVEDYIRHIHECAQALHEVTNG